MSTAFNDIKLAGAEVYVCTPCGNECDKFEYTSPGNCPYCNMALVKKSTVTFKTISPSMVCDYVKDHPDVVLLDVRTKEEFEKKSRPDYGVLENAINIPVQELEDRLEDIRELKNKDIIVYCSHSKRSPRASYILMQHGFTHVTNMSGGISTMAPAPCKR